jgi:hypothetical protein
MAEFMDKDQKTQNKNKRKESIHNQIKSLV